MFDPAVVGAYVVLGLLIGMAIFENYFPLVLLLIVAFVAYVEMSSHVDLDALFALSCGLLVGAAAVSEMEEWTVHRRRLAAPRLGPKTRRVFK